MLVSTNDHNLSSVFVFNEDSTSPLSRFNYNFKGLLNIYVFEIEKGKRKKDSYLDRIVFLDVWVGISNGSSIMGDDVRNLVLPYGLALDTAELESSSWRQFCELGICLWCRREF